MNALVLAAVAGTGVYLLVSPPPLRVRRPGARVPVPPRPLVAGASLLFLVAAALAYALFGGVLPPLAVGVFAATFPFAVARRRQERARSVAREAWPRLIEEIRLEVGALGRSVPQALFEAGRRAPEGMRMAFAAAERHWLVTTDFRRTVDVLKAALADASADAALETLLVAHEVGGSGLDRRLSALAADRAQDVRGRKAAEAEQAGVRFARRFVLVVPVGMALAGASIGTGREAYGTSAGQVAVALGVGMVAACWLWAGRLLRLPEEQRVFTGGGAGEGGEEAAR